MLSKEEALKGVKIICTGYGWNRLSGRSADRGIT